MAAKAKKSTAAMKTENGKGTYEFLVEHFSKPSTIIDAATALAGHNGTDPNAAAKEVEGFLENAKLDQMLEVKAGTGANDGQFLIARVPQSAQRKETPVKATKPIRKTATKPTGEKKVTQQDEMIRVLSHSAVSTDDFVAALKKSPAFNGKSDERIHGAVMWALSKRAAEAFAKVGKHLIAEEKGDKKVYRLVADKATKKVA